MCIQTIHHSWSFYHYILIVCQCVSTVSQKVFVCKWETVGGEESSMWLFEQLYSMVPKHWGVCSCYWSIWGDERIVQLSIWHYVHTCLWSVWGTADKTALKVTFVPLQYSAWRLQTVNCRESVTLLRANSVLLLMTPKFQITVKITFPPLLLHPDSK